MKIYVHVYVHINHALNVMCIYSSFMNEAPDRRTIRKGQWSKFKFHYLLLNVTEFRWKYYIGNSIGTQKRFQFLHTFWFLKNVMKSDRVIHVLLYVLQVTNGFLTVSKTNMI